MILIAILIGIYIGGGTGTLIAAYMLWRKTSGAPLRWNDIGVAILVLTGWPFVAIALWRSPDPEPVLYPATNKMAHRIKELEARLADKLDS
jgi:hypothetical protein